MRILMLISSLYPERIGGIQKIGSDLAHRLAKKHDVKVYTRYITDSPASEIRNSFEIKRLKSSSDLKLRILPGVRTIAIIRQIMKEKEKPDIILSMSLIYGHASYLVKKIFKIPFLLYMLGSDWSIAREKRLKGMTFRLGIKRCDSLITQTDIMKNEVLRYFPGTKIEVIPNGITLPGKRADGDKIVCLGRLHKLKGIEYLVEAVKRIKDAPELLIAGTGPEEGRLKKMAEGLNIRFLGQVPDIEESLMQGKIYVLPSLAEGLPQTVLEAMSYGLPVVATKVGGVPDVITHGKTGFLVEAKDPEGIQKYIEILLRDEELRKEMSDNCLHEVQKYSWENTTRKFEEVMEKSVKSHQGLAENEVAGD